MNSTDRLLRARTFAEPDGGAICTRMSESMVQFGMTPMQAIQSATSRAAEMLGMKGQLGVIAQGAYADIVAVSADPLKDVKALEKVVFVMKDGKVFKDATMAR